MQKDPGPQAAQAFGCFLCEDTCRAAVAVCRRCGIFVCRRHAVRLIYPPRRSPIGMIPPASSEERRRLEMVCEVCYLEELAARGKAV